MLVPTLSVGDILAVFAAGMVTGAITLAFLTYKTKRFLKNKFSK